MKGKFYGIGVGPGDPELITLKAHRILQEVDVVCVPKSYADKDSLALTVAQDSLQDKVARLELSFPMSKDKKVLEESWAKAGEEVAALVQEGKKVAFITIGDPMFYSTYGYVLAYLKDVYPAIETETIPGIMAMAACASLLQEPLAEADETIVVLPAAYGIGQLKEIIQQFDNVVLMKVSRRLPEVVDMLKSLGLEHNAMLYNRCGYEGGYHISDLDEMKSIEPNYMSLLIIRKRAYRKMN